MNVSLKGIITEGKRKNADNRLINDRDIKSSTKRS